MSRYIPRATVIYHFFYPDDVVSAVHLSEFCSELARRGWKVEALPCNRRYADPSHKYPKRSMWQGVSIRRIWRPGSSQNSPAGRLLNAAWMIASWCRIAARSSEGLPDVLVVGTDPILSVIAALVVKMARPEVHVAHWCYDIYPEVAIAEGILGADSSLVRAIKRIMKRAYRACDLIADLGPCMREVLDSYAHSRRTATLVPWALHEPARVPQPDPEARARLFGEAKLCLLYSGHFGRAHVADDLVALARRLREEGIHICFGIRGHQAGDVSRAVTPEDSNISFADFVLQPQLPARLAAADIHLVSLRRDWTGLVVPSKFFGSLAVGRPVIFSGSRESSIAKWIEAFKVGWVLEPDSLPEVADDLRRLTSSPGRLRKLQEHCHAIYQKHFCKRIVMDRWDRELRALLRRH